MSLFTKVVSKIPKRNAFNLSFPNTLTAEFGYLYPVLCKEVLPADIFELNTESLIRTAPMLAPVMSQIDVYFHYFFVPNRLLFDGWEDFITSGVSGTSPNGTKDVPVSPCVSNVSLDNVKYNQPGSLGDYLNLPFTSNTLDSYDFNPNNDPIYLSVLPFACYQKIFSDWFKDELLDSYEFEPLSSGIISDSDLIDSLWTLRKRAWKKDYFTSARPDTQLGAEVSIPGSGTIRPDGVFRLGHDASLSANSALILNAASEEDLGENFADDGYAARYATDVVDGGARNQYYADGLKLEGNSILVNDLRRALKLQEWQEKNMRGGNRYIENIFHHFGVRSSDARLQRSEFLGGVKKPIMISDIPQTSATDSNVSAQGNLAGKGTSVSAGKKIKFKAEEHGFLMCIMSIMPTTAYLQGVPRMFMQRFDRFDYAWPEFSNIGEQEVFNYEIFLDGSNNANNAGVFGYQSRYAEYKYSPPECHGEFRNALDYWHNARIFSSMPALNSDFIHPSVTGSKSMNRIFAVTDAEYGHFYVQLYHNIKALRRLSKYGIPSI